ncbi:hypothetical protein FHS57_005228 [Runella defluvii]|uniref:Uncharacterized protein n=1 Tax=Runella defluvii TaxID=370973 RepID=A0A7W5ZPA6_9BACT|nr:hypothetical protein [Runella defluvii]
MLQTKISLFHNMPMPLLVPAYCAGFALFLV